MRGVASCPRQHTKLKDEGDAPSDIIVMDEEVLYLFTKRNDLREK